MFKHAMHLRYELFLHQYAAQQEGKQNAMKKYLPGSAQPIGLHLSTMM